MGLNDHHKLGISVIPSGDRGRCKNQIVSWGKLCKKLTDPQIDTTLTHSQYLGLGVDGKNKAKDVGSYVLGQFEAGIRKKENIKTRTGVALDIDHPSEQNILWLQNELSDVCDYEFLAVTTRSHTITQQKWRLIFPTKKPIPADHYAAVSRILSSKLFQSMEESMEATDDVSHRVAQIMYFSSRSKDGRFDSFLNEGTLLDHEALLADFPGWEDWTKLPYAESRGNARPGSSTPAEVPWEKTGLVGAFCRAYSINEAMEKFIPGVYVRPRKGSGGTTRWTYSKGSGSNGAIVYPDGHLYSNHGTDPCSDRNVNAFDLVRLHRFGALDRLDDTGSDAAMSKQASFKAIRELLAVDPDTQREAQRIEDERRDAMFTSLDEDEAGEASDAFDDLDRPQPTGDPLLDDFTESPKPHVNGHAYLSNLDAEMLELLGLDPPETETSPEIDPILGEPIAQRPGKPDDDEKETPKYVESINKRHAFVMIGGKAAIIYEHRKGKIDIGSVESLHQKFENNRVPYKMDDEPASKAWMRHPKRKQFMEGITFDPTYTSTEKYNLWTGFDLKPKPDASFELIMRHIKEVVCSNVTEHYQYLLKYLAHMFQRPEDKPGVAIILKGNRGVGKDTLGYYIGKMLKDYYGMFANPEYLYGKHNRHLERKLFVHLEEATWAGDKRHDPILKSLITGKEQFIEPKGIDGYHIPSFFRIMMTSNAAWVVPAAFDERRYFVLNVSDIHQKEPNWFIPLNAEMNGDGPAAFLHYLLSLDIRSFNVRDVPDTEALSEQKDQGLTNLDLMWLGHLEEGKLPGGDRFENEDDEGDSWQRGPITVTTDELYSSYMHWIRPRMSDRYNIYDSRNFGKKLKKLCPSIEKKLKREQGSNRFFRIYVLPDLATCREEFEAYTKSKRTWNEEIEEHIETGRDVSGAFDEV